MYIHVYAYLIYITYIHYICLFSALYICVDVHTYINTMNQELILFFLLLFSYSLELLEYFRNSIFIQYINMT
jgi:hypothetical protein